VDDAISLYFELENGVKSFNIYRNPAFSRLFPHISAPSRFPRRFTTGII
jgi:hypothetical protein